MMNEELMIEVNNLRSCFGSTVIHEDLDLSVKRQEVLALVGGSGAGKTTLIRQILTLLQPAAGSIKVFGENIHKCSSKEQLKVKHRWGVMFQQGALFSALTVLENTCFPLQEFTHLSDAVIEELAMLKISMAKFPLEAVNKYPSELSGGMLKRAALARAIVMDPELLFLDEPTSGLDPNSAAALDELILSLKNTLGLTVVVITHDLDSLWKVADRVAFLGEKKVIAVGTMPELLRSTHPLLVDYFQGPRGRRRTGE